MEKPCQILEATLNQQIHRVDNKSEGAVSLFYCCHLLEGEGLSDTPKKIQTPDARVLFDML